MKTGVLLGGLLIYSAVILVLATQVPIVLTVLGLVNIFLLTIVLVEKHIGEDVVDFHPGIIQKEDSEQTK